MSKYIFDISNRELHFRSVRDLVNALKLYVLLFSPHSEQVKMKQN